MARRVRTFPDAAVVLCTIGLAVFMLGDLGSRPMQLWDESRLAVNAAEMLRHGDGLTTTYGFVPDLWNTKPPLLIDVIAASIALFGHSVLALRLPSALAACLTVAAIAGFVRGETGSRGWGLAAGIVLAASPGFYGFHAAATGDYDALLTLFTTAYALALFRLLGAAHDRPRLAAASGALIGLAVLTKGIAGVIPLVGIVAYALVFEHARLWSRRADIVRVIVPAAVLAGGFYLLRGDAAYLHAVAANDLGGRFDAVIDRHRGAPWRYLTWLFERPPLGNAPRFAAAWLLPAGIAVLWGRAASNRAAWFALFGAAGVIAVYSCAATKLVWYTVPALPMLAVLVAIGGCRAAGRLPRPARGLAHGIAAAACAALVVQAVVGRYRNGDRPNPPPRAFDRLIAAAEAAHALPLAVVDTGFANDAGFRRYAPTLRFYALGAAARGGAVAMVDAPGDARFVGSCDPATYDRVQASGRVLWDDYDCTLVERTRSGEREAPRPDIR